MGMPGSLVRISAHECLQLNPIKRLSLCTDRDFSLDFKAASASKLSLEMNGERLYDHIILFSHKTRSKSFIVFGLPPYTLLYSSSTIRSNC